MQKPVSRTFVVRSILGEERSRRGDPFIECETDAGVVAFWGSGRNSGNLRKVQKARLPFAITCGCISPSPSYAERHAYWVPETPAIPDPVPASVRTAEAQVVKADTAISRAATVPSTADLATYKVRLVEILDELEGKRIRDENPVPRIRRLGRSRTIPRTMEPLMLVVAEVRNASVHDEHPPTESERLAAAHAWQAVLEWARQRGSKVASS